MYTLQFAICYSLHLIIYIYINDILYNLIYILYTIVSTLMIFLCSLRHLFPHFLWLRSFFKKIYIQPSNRWFDLQVRRHSAECRGRIPTARALSNGWSSIHHLQRIHGDIFREDWRGKHPQVMIIDSLLPNIIGSQSSVGTVDDDFPFPKGYVMVSWRVCKRPTLIFAMLVHGNLLGMTNL